jgi:hypothetical protein
VASLPLHRSQPGHRVKASTCSWITRPRASSVAVLTRPAGEVVVALFVEAWSTVVVVLPLTVTVSV